MTFTDQLPIDDVLAAVRDALANQRSAVLVAPPGAGKTTRVPLILQRESWLGSGKILLLEPRRLAARAAAERMASLLGERVGETVGLRARLDTRVGPGTRIEVVTEGVFTRLILDDPVLTGIGCVIFDEFHERSLDADLGLALALDCRDGLREDLRILVMSATIDATGVAALLGHSPLIASDGRAYPVTTRYLGRSEKRIEDQMTDALLRAVREEPGSVLAFLPGMGEIRRTRERVAERLTDATIDLVELHGGLDGRAQSEAIRPAATGRRKIVLATAIAQTSITIEGVRIVIDCGLERVPRYEPDAGVTRLETIRASRATVDQRRGRAGRTEPGVCYRLWDEPSTAGLPAFSTPEIRAADLAPLLLDCAAWGVTDPTTLRWLDPPAAGPLAAARDELLNLAAIDSTGALTVTGRKLRSLPLPPRLARMVLEAAAGGDGQSAADIAAVLVERGISGPNPDIEERVRNFRQDRSTRADSMRHLARDWAKAARDMSPRRQSSKTVIATAELLALAFPDRIAMARGASGTFVLANGRGAHLDAASPLSRERFIVVAELSGTAANARILAAARLDPEDVERIAANQIIIRDETIFDPSAAALRTRTIRRLGAITLASDPKPTAATPENAGLMAQGIARLGLARLPWSKSQLQMRDRVAFLRQAEGDHSTYPELDDAVLSTSIETWLAPFISGTTRLADLNADHLEQALGVLIPYALRRRLDEEAPTHYEAPTGNRHPIDYEGEGAPAVAIRVQELFGLKVHPAIAAGRLPLTLHLLSPAHRPIQITRDLPRFWAGSWRDVKADMKGQYPKHVWPDDPANAIPTARAKPRK